MKKKKVVKRIKHKFSKRQIKWFHETVGKWLKRYHLTDWIITEKFSDKSSESDGEKDALAICQPDDVYHKATITFYPEILDLKKEHWSGSYVENCIKHEVAHILTAKIASLALDRHATEKQINEEIESLTQKISVIT